MNMSGERRIAAPVATVWERLNDAETLGRCIPGCQSIDKASDTAFSAAVLVTVGPVKAKFTGAVELSDIVPLTSYTLSGKGEGGVAGFAKGGADVELEADGETTVLRYQVNATVGGKLAQLGARLIDSTALKLADQFFANFARALEETA
jgi:carbon monoxide dehydrogenase subunit G